MSGECSTTRIGGAAEREQGRRARALKQGLLLPGCAAFAWQPSRSWLRGGGRARQRHSSDTVRCAARCTRALLPSRRMQRRLTRKAAGGVRACRFCSSLSAGAVVFGMWLSAPAGGRGGIALVAEAAHGQQRLWVVGARLVGVTAAQKRGTRHRLAVSKRNERERATSGGLARRENARDDDTQRAEKDSVVR